MSEDYSKHYIQNDALCPLPHTGPRVVVGFWIGPEETETKPELTGDPLFTITYPVGGGNTCYNWKHMTADPEDPLHANSANQIEWIDGHLKFQQSTEFGCRPTLGRLSDPNVKTAHWELFQDMPRELWGRIVATYEITDIAIREKAVLRFCGADGHHMSVDENQDVVCQNRLIDEHCFFTAWFPNYVWDADGGRGDRENQCYLQAANGRFLRVVEGVDGMILKADADTKKEATLFTATMSGSMISLAAPNNLTLTHNPPYGELILTSEPDTTWSWFVASYA